MAAQKEADKKSRYFNMHFYSDARLHDCLNPIILLYIDLHRDFYLNTYIATRLRPRVVFAGIQ